MSKVVVYSPEGVREEMTREEANEAVNFRKYTWKTKENPVKSPYVQTPKRNKQFTSNIKHEVEEIKTGKLFTMLTIDAKEAIASGHYRLVSKNKETPKPESTVQNQEAPKTETTDQNRAMKATELKDALTQMGISFPHNASKNQLQLLYDDAKEKKDGED